THSRNAVPQRGWMSEYRCTTSGSSSSPASYALIALCSAAWYWKTRFKSGSSEISPRYPTRRAMRMAPSTTANHVPLTGSASVMNPGVSLNSASAKPIAITNAKMSAPRESSVSIVPSSPSSCAAYCAEIESARNPIASDSPSAITPRTIGSRQSRWRAIGEEIDCETCAMSPRGVRTATAQLPGPRIITPSRTAWPPTFAIGPELGALRALCALEPALEPLDAAARVHQLLLAGVERVALRADVDVQLGLRRAGLERVPARARHRGDDVLGMNAGL